MNFDLSSTLSLDDGWPVFSQKLFGTLSLQASPAAAEASDARSVSGVSGSMVSSALSFAASDAVLMADTPQGRSDMARLRHERDAAVKVCVAVYRVHWIITVFDLVVCYY